MNNRSTDGCCFQLDFLKRQKTFRHMRLSGETFLSNFPRFLYFAFAIKTKQKRRRRLRKVLLSLSLVPWFEGNVYTERKRGKTDADGFSTSDFLAVDGHFLPVVNGECRSRLDSSTITFRRSKEVFALRRSLSHFAIRHYSEEKRTFRSSFFSLPFYLVRFLPLSYTRFNTVTPVQGTLQSRWLRSPCRRVSSASFSSTILYPSTSSWLFCLDCETLFHHIANSFAQ